MHRQPYTPMVSSRSTIASWPSVHRDISTWRIRIPVHDEFRVQTRRPSDILPCAHQDPRRLSVSLRLALHTGRRFAGVRLSESRRSRRSIAADTARMPTAYLNKGIFALKVRVQSLLFRDQRLLRHMPRPRSRNHAPQSTSFCVAALYVRVCACGCLCVCACSPNGTWVRAP